MTAPPFDPFADLDESTALHVLIALSLSIQSIMSDDRCNMAVKLGAILTFEGAYRMIKPRIHEDRLPPELMTLILSAESLRARFEKDNRPH